MAIRPYATKEHPKNPGGRPSKFNAERCESIVNDIRNRIPYEFAAEANGISEATLYEWIAIGKTDRDNCIDSDYSKFYENIKGAERTRIKEHCTNIAEHVDKWTGDAWLLERRWYKHFGSNAPLMDINKKLEQLLEEKNEKRSEERSQEDDCA